MTAANPARRISSARCGRLGAQIAQAHKDRDLIDIEARFAWRSEGRFRIS